MSEYAVFSRSSESRVFGVHAGGKVAVARCEVMEHSSVKGDARARTREAAERLPMHN